MATLQNFRFQQPLAGSDQEPSAELQFDLQFSEQQLRENQPVLLEVILAPLSDGLTSEQRPTTDGASYAASPRLTGSPEALHQFDLGPYHLDIRLEPQRVEGVGYNGRAYNGMMSPEREPAFGAHNTGTFRNGRSSNGNSSTSPQAQVLQARTRTQTYAAPEKSTETDTEAQAPEGALFYFQQRIKPEGRKRLTFKRRIALPHLDAHGTADEILLVATEQLLVRKGAEQLKRLLQTRLPYNNGIFRLPELLTEESASRLVNAVQSLWRTRRAEHLQLEFWQRDQQPITCWANLAYHDARAFEPEIHIRLSRQAQGDLGQYIQFLEELYTDQEVPALLMDDSGLIQWHNAALAELVEQSQQAINNRQTGEDLLHQVVLDAEILRDFFRQPLNGHPINQPMSFRVGQQHRRYNIQMRHLGQGRSRMRLMTFGDRAELETQQHRLTSLESQLASMVGSAPIGICVTTEDGLLETVNDAYCSIYGYRKEDLIGQPFTKMVPVDQRDIWMRTHQQFLAGQHHTRGEFKVVDASGRQLTVLADSARTVGEDGKPRKITFVVDITERLRTEEQLRSSENRLMTVFETAPVGICITSPDATFETVNEAYCNMYGYTQEELIGRSFTQIVPPEHANLWLATHDKFLQGRAETRGEFTVRHKDGRDLVVLAESTRIKGEDGRDRKVTFVLDITERKRTEAEAERARKEVEAGELRLRQIMQQAPLGICITRSDYTFETINQAYCNIYGYHSEDLIGQPFTLVVPKDRQEWWKKKHDMFLEGHDETRGEFQVIDSRGRELTILADSTRIMGADGEPRKVTFVLDITERKATEQELRDSEERLATVIDSAPIGICVTGPDYRLRSVNESYCHIYGYTREELIGQPFTKVVPPSVASHWEKTHDQFLDGQTHTRGEFEVRDKHGKKLIVLADSARITDAEGNGLKVTFVLDITDRKKKEEELKQSEARLATLIDSAPIGICVTGPDYRLRSVNESYCNIYGYTREELIGEPFTRVVPPAVASHWEKTHDQFLAGQTHTRGEFEVRGKDGRKIIVLADSARITDAEGNGLKVTFVLDITDRKKKEEELRKSEERMATLIESAPIGICVTGPDYRLRSVNESYCNIYGYTREELIGEPFTRVVPPAVADHWEKTHDQFLAGQTHTRGEFEVRGKDGKKLIVLADSARITDAEGTGLKVTFVLDITDRKKKEEELKQSEERLMTLIESAPIGICVTGADYRLRSVNDSYCAIYGYTADELIGQPFTHIVPQAVASHWEKTHDQFLMGQTHTRGEFEVVGKDGRKIIVMADSARITSSDGQPLKVTFVVDITERKANEQAMADANAALEATKAELESKNGELEASRAKLEASFAELEASKAQLETYNTELETNRQQLEQSLQEIETKNSELEASRTQLEASFAELNANKQELEAKNLELEANRKALEDSFQEVGKKNEELEANRAKLEESLAEVDQKNKALEASRTELEAKNAELETNRRKLEESFQEVGLKNEELEANRKALEESYQQLETNNAELEANRKALEDSFKQLEATNSELEENRKALEASFGELNTNKQELEAKNAELETNRKALEDSYAKLQANNAELEANRKQLEKSFAQLEANQAKLQESKDSLQESKDQLQATLDELEAMQGQLVVSEKMAALGQLIAGVAHEVNTPISAVKASVRNMIRDLPEALDGLPKLLASMPKTQLPPLREFLAAIINSEVSLTTKEERKHRKEIESLLEEEGVENADEVANTLVEIRVVEGVEAYVPLLSGKFGEQILEVAYKLGQLKVNLGNIDMASDKTSNIVKALKNYSYVQSSDRLVPSDLSRSVEDILTLMHNQTKYGIEVETNYDDDLPEVPIYPDELGQVWTNIITNGVQAMNGQGKLQIGIHRHGDTHIDVSITDSGPGVPQEIVDRIFEPFFTTKPQGEGTGLGLDISKKIIEKHQGEILLVTEPGETTFTVRLPIEPKVGKELLEDIPSVEATA